MRWWGWYSLVSEVQSPNSGHYSGNVGSKFLRFHWFQLPFLNLNRVYRVLESGNNENKFSFGALKNPAKRLIIFLFQLYSGHTQIPLVYVLPYNHSEEWLHITSLYCLYIQMKIAFHYKYMFISLLHSIVDSLSKFDSLCTESFD